MPGSAGSLYAHEVRYLAPNDFSFWKSIEILIMVVVGGTGSLPGAVLGAALVVGLPELLRDIGDYRMPAFGAILIATMLFGEGGLAAIMRRCRATVRTGLSGFASVYRGLGGERSDASPQRSAVALLEAKSVTRLFGGVRAVDAVDFW